MKKIIYFMIFLTIILVIAAILTKNIILISGGVIVIMVEYILLMFGENIFALGTKAIRAKEGRGPYEMNEQRNVIIKKTEKGYYATTFLEVIVDKESSDFKKIIRSINFPIKLSVTIYNVDLSKELEEIKEKRSKAEAKRAIEKDQYEIARLDREIAMWNNLIERIKKGEQPIEIIFYASTTASSHNKEEAIALALNQKKALKAIIASAGYGTKELIGNKLWKALELEYFSPIKEDIDV